jgi:D-serine deaminase-like pyridoxal phosphate-dependent protein
MRYDEISTPTLTIDLDALERNLDRMASSCRQQGVGLRPHTKTHKAPEVARLQLDRGAMGLTVARVGEAEVMAEAGLDDILIAFPILGAEKLRRLMALARWRRIIVALDSLAAAGELSKAASEQGSTVGVLVEFDVGSRRCGLEPGPPCVELASKITGMPGLSFRGLMAYFGNVWGSKEERRAEAQMVAGEVERTLAAFRVAGREVEIVSGGSTPSAEFAYLIPGLTEIRPGLYVYNDLNTFYQGACRLEDCAARVVTTVVSTAVSGRAIIDAGLKTLSSSPLGSGPKSGYGYVVEAPEASIMKLSEEHGHLDITGSTHRFYVGEILTVIPNQVGTCVNMHDEVFTLRDGMVQGSWRVAARGKI